jgi:hypothetical protein
MPSATERLEINSYLAKRGLGQLDDPGTIHQLAFLVQDHDHFRQLLQRCDPLLRRKMYEAMRPGLRFTPRALDAYVAEMAAEADRRKMPAYDQETGKLIAYADYDPGGKVEPLERQAEKAIHHAYQEQASGGHKLTIVCAKCTAAAEFTGPTMVSATMNARQAGWVYQEVDGKGVEICPKCPSAKPVMTKAGNA